VNVDLMNRLLPDGTNVSFSEIDVTVLRLAKGPHGRGRAPARALIATVVVVGSPPRLAEAAEALAQLDEISGVRTILISEGEESAPVARVTQHSIAIAGLAPDYIDNAVAALRLSSLPALVWWRGGSLEALDDVSALADRLVLDTESPLDTWTRALGFVERTGVTDLRWTRLTRWRSLLAHLFDVPHVRAAASRIRRLSISAGDIYAARLFAGWLRTALRWPSSVAISIKQVESDGQAPLERVQIDADGCVITLQMASSRTCLQAVVEGEAGSSRIVPLGDTDLHALIGEELGVRTRDLAFERALAAACGNLRKEQP